MKPRLFGALVVAFALAAIGGASAIDLSVDTTTGTLFGVAHEYVYDQSVSPNYMVSRLDWHFQPVYYYGVKAKLKTAGGLLFGLSAKSGISGRTGIMEDSDFLNGDGVKTLYSQSDNYLEQALLARLELGYQFPGSRKFSFTPLFVLDYQKMKWTGRDGYLQYPPSTGYTYYFDQYGNFHYGTTPDWSSNLPKTPIYGPGVIYQQRFLIPAVGLSAAFQPRKELMIVVSCSYSPFVFGEAVDDHVLRQLTITDTFSSGTYVEPRLEVDYAVSPRFNMSFTAAYRLITGLVGNSTWQNDGTTSTSPDSQYIAGPSSGQTVTKGGGASFSAFDAALSFRLSL